MTAAVAAGMVCTTVSCIHAHVHLCLLVFSELVVVRCRWFLSDTDLPSTSRGTHTGHHGTDHHSYTQQGLRIGTCACVHIQNEAMFGHVCFCSVFTYMCYVTSYVCMYMFLHPSQAIVTYSPSVHSGAHCIYVDRYTGGHRRSHCLSRRLHPDIC